MNKEKEGILVAVGNVYLDTNIFGVQSNEENKLIEGKEYFAERSETVLGGSSMNFLMQARQLGSNVAFIGQVGNDIQGKEIKNLLNEKHIISELVVTSETEITSLATNLILQHHGGFIGIHWGDASRNLLPEQININHPLLQKAKGIYFGGTAKQQKLFEKLPHVFSNLKRAGIRIFTDPNRFPMEAHDSAKEIFLDAVQYAECYLPNEEELRNITGEDNLNKSLEIVLGKGAKLIIVKLGKEGCRIKTNAEDLIVPGFPVNPITTVGAGDAFNAGFITQYLQGKSLEVCGKFANAVAALKVSQNIFPNTDEVDEFLQNI